MGSPITPVLSSHVLGHNEHLWLNNFKGPSIHFYCRYVDDTFCLSTMNIKFYSFFNFSIHNMTTSGSLWKKKSNQIKSNQIKLFTIGLLLLIILIYTKYL